ncbi:MAG: hypothetical protein A3K19_16430 [Lentisphaerae bacterium RIFOXYB12_FULL_65_16]|nr:MAG: hypothetical protein A3K19_16430 [Lentisphaerae bacterium RIFOXYB12_FULL_65_16]
MIGRAVVQRLVSHAGLEVQAFVHNTGNAWPLLRFGLSLRTADLCSRRDADEAVRGCTHVVNCALGVDDELVEGMRNLLEACRRHHVERLVHLSSVTVYGEPPASESTDERAPARARRGTYGWYKMEQDRMVLRAQQQGLSSAVLCLPHVVGPGSRLLLAVLRALREQRFTLVDDGIYPVNVVDLANVCHAVELALRCSRVDGRRVFITNDDSLTWRDLISALAPLAEVVPDGVPVIASDAARALTGDQLTLAQAALTILTFEQVKAVLRRTVLQRNLALAAAIRTCRRLVRGACVGRADFTPRMASGSRAEGARLDPALCLYQLRRVRHSCDRAKRELGYLPVCSFAQSLSAFRRWYETAHGVGTEWWPLLRELST